MEKVFSEIKKRILQIPERKGISKASFFKATGVSYDNFKGTSLKSELKSDALGEIYSSFKDINLEWVLTGVGEMLKTDKTTTLNEPSEVYTSEKNLLVEQLQERLVEKDEYIKELKSDKKTLTKAIEALSRKKTPYSEMLSGGKSKKV